MTCESDPSGGLAFDNYDLNLPVTEQHIGAVHIRQALATLRLVACLPAGGPSTLRIQS